MMKNHKEITDSDQPIKPRRPKSREVSSRYLSPSSTPTHDIGIQSLAQGSSPMRRKSGTSSQDSRKHWSLEELGFARGLLWPSATAISSPSQSSNKKLDTLADHLGNDRLNDLLDRKGGNKVTSAENSVHLSRQRSGTEINRIKNVEGSSKENHRPILGGSMRYAGNLLFPGRKSSSSSNKGSDNPAPMIPGRFSVDENALFKKSSRRKSDSFTDLSLESESECSDISSSASNLSSMTTMGKAGIEVSSKYMNDVSGRSRRGTSDSNVQHPLSFDETARSNKCTVKGTIKRASSLTGYRSAMSQWALSPGRSSSSPMSVENKERSLSFSSLKPPSSPSRHTGVEKLLNMGLDLFKSKKTLNTSSLGPAGVENVHQLRLLHNRLIQWQYANAKADAAYSKITSQTERNLACAWSSLTKLQRSVLQKKLQMVKEKFQMKLDLILHSQIRPLETWGDMERQHLLAISKTTESLQSIVCRLPLIEGAEVEPQSTSFALRHALDLTTSIKSAITDISPSGDGTVPLLSELAKVVGQEKLLLEECLEYLRTISTLEIQERSLTCSMIQMDLWQQQQQQQQLEQVQL